VQSVRTMLHADGISIAHYDMRYLKPIDENILHTVFKKFKHIVTVEDGTIVGGLGSAVLEFMSNHQYQSFVARLGIPDRFIEHGKVEELQHECGYDADGIYKTIHRILKNKPKNVYINQSIKN
jgi:1-deoxy-D-xylulose-5-phosphate synthase